MYHSDEERYKVFDYLLEGCQVIDEEYRYVYLNDAVVRQSKLSRPMLIGRTMMECYPGIEDSEMFVKLKNCMEYGMPSRMVNEFDYPDQSKGWFELVLQKVPEGVLIMSNDITSRVVNENELKIQNKKLKALREIDMAILRSTDLVEVLNTVCQQTLDTVEVDAVDIMLYDNKTQQLDYFTGHGFSGSDFKKLSVKITLEWMAMLMHPQKLPMHLSDIHFKTCPDLKTRLRIERFRHAYMVPLHAKDKFIGVFEAYVRGKDVPDKTQVSFLQTLGNQAAVAIETNRLYQSIINKNEELMNAYDSTIEGWSRALEIRDVATEGHTLRVTELATEFAEHLGYIGIDMKAFKYGCLMHDIGKIGVPDKILNKAGPLNQEEWEQMKMHPVYAKKLLKSISFLEEASMIPFYHHEWYNGHGYPDGLKGRKIPLSARIFAIVDVFDALTSDRPYRRAWTKEEAIEHIKASAGTQFDKELVKKFIAFLGEDKSQSQNRTASL